MRSLPALPGLVRRFPARPHIRRSPVLSARAPQPLARRPIHRFLALLWTATLCQCLGAPDPLPARPIAVAGIDLFADVEQPVLLDGGESTSHNGGTLTYSWRFEVLPEDSLLTVADFDPNDSTVAEQTRFVPDRAGRYVIGLLVDDGVTTSYGDYVVVEVGGALEAPIAEAGPDQVVQEGMAVYFDGTAGNAQNSQTLYYRWRLEGTPDLSQKTQSDLVNAYTPYPTLIVDTGGLFTLSLVVSDGITESEPDYVYVTVVSNNSAPVAAGGGDRTVEACTNVVLDGSASYDIDQDPMTYSWEMKLQPLHSTVTTGSIASPEEAVASFYADKTGNYVVELVVGDGETLSTPDVVNLTAVPRAENQPPVTEAGGNQALSDKVVCTGSGSNIYCPDCPAVTLTLSGEGTSDPDEDSMTYLWAVEEGNAQVKYPTRLTTSVDLRGASTTLGATVINTYRFSLTATDCPGDEGVDEVEIEYTCTGTN